MSPSIPTHTAAAKASPVPIPFEGIDGVGTVKAPETALNVCPAGGALMTAPAQLEL